MKELREAGLTENESKVYLALIDLGPSLAGRISRKTGLHRRTVYDTTEMLIQKGLIGYILENNRRLFNASNPERFREILEEKKAMIDPVIDKLKSKFNEKKEKDETNFFKGKAGLKTVFEDQLNYKEVLILGASPKATEILKFYFKWYNQKRKQRKIKVKMIAQDRSIDSLPLAEIRYLPKKHINPLAINIYGDKTAIILWSEEKPAAIVINQKDITKGYRSYFDILWKSCKK